MGVWDHVWQVILQGLTASIGINLVILPILLYYFFEFPLYSESLCNPVGVGIVISGNGRKPVGAVVCSCVCITVLDMQ